MSRFQFALAQFGDQIIAELLKDKTALTVFNRDESRLHALQNYEPQTYPDQKKQIFTAFASLTDPSHDRKSGKYKYLHFITQSYVQAAKQNTPILAEDFYKIRQDLADFEIWGARLKSDGHSPDIQSYNSFEQLREILAPYQQNRDVKKVQKAERSMSDEQKQTIMDETTILYEGPEGKTLVPHTMRASQYWGSQTKWCISAKEEEGNPFDRYYARQPVIMYFPVVTPEEKQEFSQYTSFKFASDDGFQHIFDERDETDQCLPESMESLWRKTQGELKKENIHAYLHYGLNKNFPINGSGTLEAFLDEVSQYEYGIQRTKNLAEIVLNIPDLYRELDQEIFRQFSQSAVHFLKGDSYKIWEDIFLNHVFIHGLRFESLSGLSMDCVLQEANVLQHLTQEDKNVLKENVEISQLLAFMGIGYGLNLDKMKKSLGDKYNEKLPLNMALVEVLKKTMMNSDNDSVISTIVYLFPESDLSSDLFDDDAFMRDIFEVFSDRFAPKGMVYNIVTHDGFERFKDSKEAAHSILSAHGEYLEDFSDTIRDDKEIVLLAIESFPASYAAASPRLQKDDEVLALRGSKEIKAVDAPKFGCE